MNNTKETKVNFIYKIDYHNWSIKFIKKKKKITLTWINDDA